MSRCEREPFLTGPPLKAPEDGSGRKVQVGVVTELHFSAEEERDWRPESLVQINLAASLPLITGFDAPTGKSISANPVERERERERKNNRFQLNRV
jgi:hypothetical protein